MTDKPILFSAPMVRAILEGRKTQTRRRLKICGKKSFTEFGPSDTRGYDWTHRDDRMLWHDYRNDDLLKLLPFQKCDRLWVRETVKFHAEYDHLPPSEVPVGADVQYMANDPLIPWDARTRISIHMPKWASRITLNVTDVRVERLQDISEADSIAEGVGRRGSRYMRFSARHAFEMLWNSINGEGAWDENPWVMAVSFEPVFKNILKLEAA